MFISPMNIPGLIPCIRSSFQYLTNACAGTWQWYLSSWVPASHYRTCIESLPCFSSLLCSSPMASVRIWDVIQQVYILLTQASHSQIRKNKVFRDWCHSTIGQDASQMKCTTYPAVHSSPSCSAILSVEPLLRAQKNSRRQLG